MPHIILCFRIRNALIFYVLVRDTLRVGAISAIAPHLIQLIETVLFHITIDWTLEYTQCRVLLNEWMN